MIRVRLDELEVLVNEVAATAGFQARTRRSGSGDRQTLFMDSAAAGCLGISLTTIEAGTLFFELSSGHRADWLIRDDSDLGTMKGELRAMVLAVLEGNVSASGVLQSDGQRFRLSGGGPLGRIRLILNRHAYPSVSR